MADDAFSIEPNPQLEGQVEGSDLVKSAALVVAEEIVAQWKADAPIGDDDTSGDYEAGINAMPTSWGAMIMATDFTSAWLEFGVPAHGIAPRFIGRNAVLKAGYQFAKGKH